MNKQFYTLIFLLFFTKPLLAQNDQFIGEIRLFGFNLIPKGWAKCEGQLLAISQNTALFSILGTTYGGDGKTTFALPDLRDRMAVGFGQGPGLTNIDLGEMKGNPVLSPENLPPHTHTGNLKISSSGGTTSTPSSTVSLAAPVQVFNGNSRPVGGFINASPSLSLPNMSTSTSGNSEPVTAHPVMSSTYCIALQGIFPPRS
jgi:microcystin-dependent protein